MLVLSCKGNTSIWGLPSGMPFCRYPCTSNTYLQVHHDKVVGQLRDLLRFSKLRLQCYEDTIVGGKVDISVDSHLDLTQPS